MVSAIRRRWLGVLDNQTYLLGTVAVEQIAAPPGPRAATEATQRLFSTFWLLRRPYAREVVADRFTEGSAVGLSRLLTTSPSLPKPAARRDFIGFQLRST